MINHLPALVKTHDKMHVHKTSKTMQITFWQKHLENGICNPLNIFYTFEILLKVHKRI